MPIWDQYKHFALSNAADRNFIHKNSPMNMSCDSILIIFLKGRLSIKSDFHNGFLQGHHADLPPKTFRYKRSGPTDSSFFDGMESELQSDPQALLKVLLGDYFYPSVEY